MKISATLIILTLALTALTLKTDFLTEQKKFVKVRIAFKEKETLIKKKLNEISLKTDNFNILITVYKDSDELDIYAKKKTIKFQKAFTKLINLTRQVIFTYLLA